MYNIKQADYRMYSTFASPWRGIASSPRIIRSAWRPLGLGLAVAGAGPACYRWPSEAGRERRRRRAEREDRERNRDFCKGTLGGRLALLEVSDTFDPSRIRLLAPSIQTHQMLNLMSNLFFLCLCWNIERKLGDGRGFRHSR